MTPSPLEVTQQPPAHVAQLMVKWNDAVTEILRAQPSLTFCANQLVLEALAKSLDKHPTEHLYLKNPEDSLIDSPSANDRTLQTLAQDALHQCRIPAYYHQRSDFYLYKNGAFLRLGDAGQIAIRTLMNQLLGVEYYLNDLNQFWRSNHSATQQPRSTYIAQALAFLIQCEASLRFETASLDPASVALVRQLGTAALPGTLNLFHLNLQDITGPDELALVGAFALCTWPLDEPRTSNPTVLYLPRQGLIGFTSSTALKTHITRLFKTEPGREQLLVSLAHRHHPAFTSLAPRANKDARVNLVPVTGVEHFFHHQVGLLLSKQRQDIEYHWAVHRDAPEGVVKKVDQAASLFALLDFSRPITRHARPLLITRAQQRGAAVTAQQQLMQTQADRLIDFPGLLAQLNSLQAGATQQPLADAFFTPHRQSPLFKACARAVEVLNKLKDDSDFADWMRQRSSPAETDWSPLRVLEKLVNNQPALADSPLTRFTVQGVLLPLSTVPIYWRNDVNVLIAARRDVGDGIRADGTVRLDLALKFYAVPIAAYNPLQQMIERLQEHAASLSLDLGAGELPFDQLMDEQDDANLQRRINQQLITGNGSIFKQLTLHFLTPQREAQALKTPTVVLEQWFKTRQCIELGNRLVNALDWYTAEGETPPEKVLRNVVWRALWLHFEHPKGNARTTVAGEEIATPLHWGYNYNYIHRQLEQSLSHNSQLTPGGIQLAKRLLQQASASEVWVRDIPDDLHYASSIAWVNFKAAVALAHAITPGSAQHMTFPQLLGLLATTSENTTPEQKMVIALARLGPTLEWAKANGVLTSENKHTPEQAQLAVKALEEHEEEIIQATTTISQAPPGRWRFTSDEAFERGFSDYLSGAKSAYQTFIRALLPNLPLPDRCAIENGEVTLYALRQELTHVTIERETAQNTGAARGRHGFIIQAREKHRTTFYEVFPRAAVIRARPDIQTLTVNGKVVVESTGGSSRPGKATFRRATPMPFDWAAYQQGQRPREEVSSLLIAEPIGQVLPATAPAPSEYMRAAQTLTSVRSRQLAAIVAGALFHTDESQLKLSAKRNTSLVEAAQETIDDFIFYAKMLVPFWGGIEDIASGDPQRVESGALSLFTDLISFAAPIGKYVGGSTRLIAQAGKISFQAALPKFATLTKTFLLASLKELNPLEVVPSLLKIGGLSALRLSVATVRQIDTGLALFRKTFVKPPFTPSGRVLQSVDPQAWKPFDPQDGLFTVAGIDHVPMRKVGTDLLPEYRLIDPLTHQAFGPRYIPFGEEGLQRIPDLDAYIAPVPYEQSVEFSRRANGVYDGKNQQSYVRSRGQWYVVETRHSLTGDTEFYIVHPHNKTRSTHRIVNEKGVWTPVGESGHAGGKKLKKLKKANAERDTQFKKAREQMDKATALMDQAAQSREFNMAHPIYDKSLLHFEAAHELGQVHTKNNELPVFKPQDFSATPDFGRARLIESIEVANNLSPRYTAVIDDLEGYLEVQQKNLQPVREAVEQEGPLKTLIDGKRKAVNTIIEQAKVFKSLLDEDLERMLGTLETLPARQAGPAHIPPNIPLPPAPPNLDPPTLVHIPVAGDHPRNPARLLAKPRAENSNIADTLDGHGQRIETYINLGEDKLWVKSPIQIKEPGALASSSQTAIIQELNGATKKMVDVIEEHDDLIRFYRSKASSEPAGAQARLKSGATKLNQGADDLEAACIAVTDEEIRQRLIAQARRIKQEAVRIDTMAQLVRQDLVIKQAPDAKGLAFLHSQPEVLNIRKSLDRVAFIRHIPMPDGEDWIQVPDFLDEFRIYAQGKLWAYAHMHFEQASHSVPVKSHLMTPEQRGLGVTVQADVAREGRQADIYRAEIDWSQARQFFYSTAAS
nr:hypothetical protein [uncultured Pseudomonas sp.]